MNQNSLPLSDLQFCTCKKNAAMVAEKENAGKIFCNTFETLISKGDLAKTKKLFPLINV